MWITAELSGRLSPVQAVCPHTTLNPTPPARGPLWASRHPSCPSGDPMEILMVFVKGKSLHAGQSKKLNLGVKHFPSHKEKPHTFLPLKKSHWQKEKNGLTFLNRF